MYPPSVCDSDSHEGDKCIEVMVQDDCESGRTANSYDEKDITDFALGRVLGCGKFGCVYLAHEKKSKLLVAIKTIDLKQINTQQLKRQLFYEVYYHSVLQHPNIAKVYSCFQGSRSLYLVLEFASEGSLYTKMIKQKYNRFHEKEAAKYIYQTADALNYCHNLGFFHGDVKPENILLNSYGDVKLCDFGFAWPSDDTAYTYRNYICGTRDYLAPEQRNQKPYNEKIDHWSLGVMCFELLVGKSPFCKKKREKRIEKLLTVEINFPKLVSKEARNLICRLLTFEPIERICLPCVMCHGWFHINYIHPDSKMIID